VLNKTKSNINYFSVIADTKRHKNEIFLRIQSKTTFGFEKNKKTSLIVSGPTRNINKKIE